MSSVKITSSRTQGAGSLLWPKIDVAVAVR